MFKRFLIIFTVITTVFLASSCFAFASLDDTANYQGWNYSTTSNLPSSNPLYPNSWYRAILNQVWDIWTQVNNQAVDTNNIYHDIHDGFQDSQYTGNAMTKFLYYMNHGFQSKFTDFYNAFIGFESAIRTKVDLSNTYLSNIQGYTSSTSQHLGTLVSAFGYTSSSTLKTDIGTIITGLGNLSDIKNNTGYIDDIYNTLGFTTVNTARSYLQSINTNIEDVEQWTQYTQADTAVIRSKAGTIDSTLSDLYDLLDERLGAVQDPVINETVELEFLDTNAPNRIKASDITSMSSGLSNIKTAFEGGATPGSAFNVLSSNSSAWGWFSDEVAQDLDTTGSVSNNSRLRSGSSSTPLYDEYLRYIFSHIGGDVND